MKALIDHAAELGMETVCIGMPHRGGDSRLCPFYSVPGMKALIDHAAELGMETVCIGMPHRGGDSHVRDPGVPDVNAVTDHAAELGLEKVCIGMPHRGGALTSALPPTVHLLRQVTTHPTWTAIAGPGSARPASPLTLLSCRAAAGF